MPGRWAVRETGLQRCKCSQYQMVLLRFAPRTLAAQTTQGHRIFSSEGYSGRFLGQRPERWGVANPTNDLSLTKRWVHHRTRFGAFCPFLLSCNPALFSLSRHTFHSATV